MGFKLPATSDEGSLADRNSRRPSTRAASARARIVDYARSRHPQRRYGGLRHYAYAGDFLLWLIAGRALFGWSGFQAYVEAHTDPTGYWAVASVVLGVWRLLFLCKDGIAGYSPGKWLFGLRVVDAETGMPIGMARSLKRNLLLTVPLLGESIVYLGTRLGERWLDGWAKCIVVSARGAA